MTELTAEQRARVLGAMAMVEEKADRIHKAWPKARREDLVAAGHHALVEACQRHNPAQSELAEFAAKRVNGAMAEAAFKETFGRRRTRATLSASARDASLRTTSDLASAVFRDGPAPEPRAGVVDGLRDRIALMMMGATPTPEEAVIGHRAAQEAFGALRAAVAALQPDEQLFLRMFYEEEATVEQIAAKLGVSGRTVLRMHQRLKAGLKRSLLEKGVTESPH